MGRNQSLPFEVEVACEVVLQHLLQSLSATHQGDEHKHAPEHAEARKQTAALVPRDGVENLFICI